MKVEHSEKNLLMQIANGFRASRGIRKNLDGEALVELANQVVESKPEQEKTVEITENGTMEIAADEGKALSKITAVVNVPISAESKISQFIDGTITEITAEDFAGITSIGEYGLAYRINLTSVTIPNNIMSIGKNAFEGCKKLKSVTIPDSITTLGESMFYLCYGLVNITIPNSVKYLGTNVFYYCKGLKNIILPDSIVAIPNNAFRYCESLTSVTIGSGVKNIGIGSFAACDNLTSIVIPNNVEYINSSGLLIGSPTNKGTIIFLGTTPPSISSGAFGTNYLNKIIVPKGCGEAYKTATNWANFADFIEEAAE